MKLRLSIVAAMGLKRVIGLGNKMPWHLPEDLKHFKELTLGKPVIMGRKTFESIGKPLPGRNNIILTRQSNLDNWQPGMLVSHSLEGAYNLCDLLGYEEAFIIGGEDIFRQAIGDCQRLYLTEIDKEFEGDTYFPEFSAEDWSPQEIGSLQRSKNDIFFRFCTYERNT